MNNITRSLSSRLVRFMLFLMLIFVVSDYVDARPGGGSSSRSRSSGGSKSSGGGGYSSGGGSRKSSGGGGYSSSRKSSRSSSYDDDDDRESRPMTWQEAKVLLTLLGIGLVVFIVIIGGRGAASFLSSISSSRSAYTSSDKPTFTAAQVFRPQEEEDDLQNMQANAQKKLAAFKQTDPNFSETLLLDYVQNVFHQYYSALGNDKINNLKPFFINHINTADNHKYTEIVINALYIIGVDTTTIKGKSYDRIKVMLETNFTQTEPNNNRRLRYLSEQEWHFVRARYVESLPPAKMQALACPSCGAPESFHDDKKCGACGTVIEPAAMQWAVQLQKRVFDETYETNALVSYEDEMGTNDATIYAPNLKEMHTAFEKLHGIDNAHHYFLSFTADVVRPAFMAIYSAWTAKDLAPVRHLISDFLYQTQEFWIQEYKAQGLTNHLDDIQVTNTQLAKINIDKFYETFTVRIFANCKDYTTKDSDGSLVGGEKDKKRYFSEYWTFVRRIGKEQKTKDSLDLHACPSCSAPIDKMGMTGICGYCTHKVSSGDYSWVLSRITQDEAYN